MMTEKVPKAIRVFLISIRQTYARSTMDGATYRHNMITAGKNNMGVIIAYLSFTCKRLELCEDDVFATK